MVNYPIPDSAGSWEWLLAEKYGKKKALQRFFEYLEEFKNALLECSVIEIANETSSCSIKNNFNQLSIGVSKSEKDKYDKRIKEIGSVLFYKLSPSPTQFFILLNKSAEIITMDRDIAGKYANNLMFHTAISKRLPTSRELINSG